MSANDVHPDELMWSYYELVTDRTPQEIAALKQEVTGGKLHPWTQKCASHRKSSPASTVQTPPAKPPKFPARLPRPPGAYIHVRDCHQAESNTLGHRVLFDGRRVRAMGPTGLSTRQEKWSRLLSTLELVPSTSEAERLIKQGGFEIDGKTLQDPTSS